MVHSLFPRYGIIDNNIYKIIAFFSLDLFSKGDIHLQGSPICDMYGKYVKYQLHKYVTGNITSKCIEELGYMKTYLKISYGRNWELRAAKYLYQELDLYCSVIDKISINVWWRFTAFHPGCVTRVSCVMAVVMDAEHQLFHCNLGVKCAGYAMVTRTTMPCMGFTSVHSYWPIVAVPG